MKSAWKRFIPLGPLILLAVATVVLPGVMASCGQEQPVTVEQPRTIEGVPTIRVRITPTPADTAILSTTGGYRLKLDGHDIVNGPAALAATSVRRVDKTWVFNDRGAEGNVLSVEPQAGSFVRVGNVLYRGWLRFLPVEGDRFIIVNHVDVESYLAGVLPKELYPAWMSETYRAVAVAARTFAVYQSKTYGPAHEYDLGDDQASQMYGGFSAETDKSWNAVRQTHGQVLVFGPRGAEQIFLAQYSACCGGVVNGAYVLRNAPQVRPLLGGQECTYCRNCPRYRWDPVIIAKADIRRALMAAYSAAAELDRLDKINVVSSAASSRPIWLDVVGANGKSLRVRADDLRLALLRLRDPAPAAQRLYSMNCRLQDLGDSIAFCDGRGYGHGVGLCQWGAQGMAAEGIPAEQILSFYYPGAKLYKAY